ncbi:hypothetical protein NDU88_003800 [Pleurodeles waltl]|uniref:Uncharacterized protein n=1 Tax=Pleurodeles waltl TaxID=8319 RepID=A0AAV7LGS3_PLEWA|nr:hypothetical protein NDU88_003800 [Pleurodeles waltl]
MSFLSSLLSSWSEMGCLSLAQRLFICQLDEPGQEQLLRNWHRALALGAVRGQAGICHRNRSDNAGRARDAVYQSQRLTLSSLGLGFSIGRLPFKADGGWQTRHPKGQRHRGRIRDTHIRMYRKDM